ncbi:MAG: hypothetical protein COA39_012375 [Sulfurimonas sp.]|nr:hypothetical protein [Sulfurimonas sp.]
MSEILPMEIAKKIEIELNEQNFDFEVGYDIEGLLHIQCGIDDESKITEVVDSMNLEYQSFMCFGSFCSDAIVEELVA